MQFGTRSARRRAVTGVARRPFGRAALLAAGIGLAVGAPAVLAMGSSAAGASTFRATLGYPAGQTITIAPGSNGYQQYAFVDRTGAVYWREEASGVWSKWASLAASQATPTPTTLTGEATLTWAPGRNGSTLELFTENVSGDVVATWLSGSKWSTWTALGTPSTTVTGTFTDGQITWGPGTGGNLQEVFAAAHTGTHLDYVLYEKTEGQTGAWGKWTAVGTTSTITTLTKASLTWAPGSDGSTQELFAYMGATGNTARQVFVTWTSHGTWHSWVTFDPTAATKQGPITDTAPFSGGITYAPGSNGSLQEVFAAGVTGTVFVNWENPGGWAGWHDLGRATTGFATSRITYAPGSNGSVQEIFAITGTTTGGVWVDWENPNGSWSGWKSMGMTSITFDHDTSASSHEVWDVSYAAGSNGSLQEIAATSVGYSTYPTATYVDWENPGGGWSGWVQWSTTTDSTS